MGIDLIFKVAAIGILLTVLDQVLRKSGREDMATMVTLTGVVVTLFMVSREIANLFNAVKTMFQLG